MHLATTQPAGSMPSAVTARDLIIEARKAVPKGTRHEQFAHFQKLLAESPEHRRSVEWYFFSSIVTDLEPRQFAPRPTVDRGPYQRAVEVEQERVKADIKAKIVLLGLLMPNGKPMRECSGQEMASFGDAYKRIADRVGKLKLVGAVLDEDGVRALLA